MPRTRDYQWYVRGPALQAGADVSERGPTFCDPALVFQTRQGERFHRWFLTCPVCRSGQTEAYVDEVITGDRFSGKALLRSSITKHDQIDRMVLGTPALANAALAPGLSDTCIMIGFQTCNHTAALRFREVGEGIEVLAYADF